MVQKPKLTLKIQNENYAEFNGFEISFSGFDKLPYQMSSPLGFTAGKYILEKFKESFGQFELTITSDKNSSVDIDKVPVQINLKYDDLRALAREFRANYTREGRRTVAKHLSTLFSEEFEAIESSLPAGIEELKLSHEDIQETHHLLPVLAKYDIESERDLKRLLAGKKVLHYLHLEKVLKEFEGRLKTKFNEYDWQTFFRKNLLILNPGYMEIIEKANISLNIKFPDFLLLNIEGYVDVYEIKVPETDLLKYDNSRKNYYWSADIAKAISQVENYIESLNRNRDGLILEIKEQYKLDLKILRPRGYILAGHSSQLKEPSRKNDYFRLLNESLRNTRVLPYDNFLETFKNFSKTLKEVHGHL